MKEPDFLTLVILILSSMLMLLGGLYLLAKFNTLFRRQIKNELLRKNIVVWMIAVCFVLAITPTHQEFYGDLSARKILQFLFRQIGGVTIEALFVFNIIWLVIQYLNRRKLSFRKKMGISLFVIIAGCVLIDIPISYFSHNHSFKNLEYGLLFNFYTGCITGLVYVTMSYVDLEKQRKLNAKELEVSRLRELKTKAELDALHSKINPHFLYNALNSIADLSITDGKKGRQMTIALADLFRYSINYGDNNFSTVKEEVEMAEVYLQIEKIRFEGKLNYAIHVDEELRYYLVPRFILQPLVENAVKHGLKATGKVTEIRIEVNKTNPGMALIVSDNGPEFPDSLIPGYGTKSVYDKLDMLLPDNYEMHFSNKPGKQVAIYLHKLVKNETAV